VFSALLLTLSLPPHDAGLLAWCALAPLLYGLRQRGLFAAACQGLLFGFLFWLGSHTWVHSLGLMSPLSRFLLPLALSVYFVIFGLLYRLVSGRLGPWIIVAGPALWVALEHLRSTLFFLAWPWNLAGHSQHLFLPVIQVADLAGVYGISFVLLMSNQLLSQVPELIAAKRNGAAEAGGRPAGAAWAAQALLFALVMAGVLAYGWRAMAAPDGGKTLRAAIVQANLVAHDGMSQRERKAHLEDYLPMTREAVGRGAELIIWPASSLPAPPSVDRVVRDFVRGLAKETGVHLLVGGAGVDKVTPRKEGYTRFYANSEYLVAPSGRYVGQYNKMKLLPFNEYIPLQGKVTWPRWITPLEESFLPGEEFTVFEVKEARFGTPICSENSHPSHYSRFVREGANFMVSATNDAFFGVADGPYQTFVSNVFRAVENGVAVARASTTGISAFIGPDGRVVERVMDGRGDDLFVSGLIMTDVPLAEVMTFYTRHGDLFARVIDGVAVFSILTALAVSAKSRSTEGEERA
jgi:apolipoprotein N-acyltransferase